MKKFKLLYIAHRIFKGCEGYRETLVSLFLRYLLGIYEFFPLVFDIKILGMLVARSKTYKQRHLRFKAMQMIYIYVHKDYLDTMMDQHWVKKWLFNIMSYYERRGFMYLEIMIPDSVLEEMIKQKAKHLFSILNVLEDLKFKPHWQFHQGKEKTMCYRKNLTQWEKIK